MTLSYVDFVVDQYDYKLECAYISHSPNFANIRVIVHGSLYI
jgi:hypothetical protein